MRLRIGHKYGIHKLTGERWVYLRSQRNAVDRRLNPGWHWWLKVKYVVKDGVLLITEGKPNMMHIDNIRIPKEGE